MIYYKFLFDGMKMLSVNEKIVYSALVNYSIKLSGLFFEDGCLDMEGLKKYVSLDANAAGYSKIELRIPSLLEMSSELKISRSVLRKTFNRFKSIRLMTENTLVCHKDLFNQGFLVLPTDLTIKGQLLVFYCLLEYRSRPYDGIIDTHADRLRVLFGMEGNEIGAVYDMLYKLHKKGFIQRLQRNRLRVVPIDRAPKREEASQPSP